MIIDSSQGVYLRSKVNLFDERYRFVLSSYGPVFGSYKWYQV